MDMLYIKIFFDDLDVLEPLSDEEKGRLLTAVLSYASTGNIPQLCGNERFLFPVFKGRVDREQTSLSALTEVRSRNGKLGGRPRSDASGKDGSAAVSASGEKLKKLNKDNTTDKDKDKEKEKAIEINADAEQYTDKETDTVASVGCAGRVSCLDVISLFNSICDSLPRVHSLSDRRKRLINARISETSGDINAFRAVFEAVRDSDFLSGRVAIPSGWRATFDWIMEPANWDKILDGCYVSHAHFASASDSTRQASRSAEKCECTYDISEIQAQMDAEWDAMVVGGC